VKDRQYTNCAADWVVSVKTFYDSLDGSVAF